MPPTRMNSFAKMQKRQEILRNEAMTGGDRATPTPIERTSYFALSAQTAFLNAITRA